MVWAYVLMIRDDNSSVTDLRPDDTAEKPFWYTFKVQCTSCRETHANAVSVSRFVSLGSRDIPPECARFGY